MKINYILKLEVRFNKHGNVYRCHCDQYKLQGRSTESFEKAYDDLLKLIEEITWQDSYHLTVIRNSTYEETITVSENGKFQKEQQI